MKNKTCGKCKYLDGERYCEFLDFEPKPEMGGCANFEPKPTNGDRIIAGGMRALAEFHMTNTCCTCVYWNKKSKSHVDSCTCPKDKKCVDGIEAWLNAPAESERKE